MSLHSFFQRMDLSGTGCVSANEFAAVVPSFRCGVRKEMLTAVFRLIQGGCSQGRLQGVDLIAKPKPESQARRPSCSRSKSPPRARSGPCSICGGVAPASLDSPPPSCGHWELSGAGWHVVGGVCFACMDFPPNNKYGDSSLPAPSCGHWAFSTARCGCRRPDGKWHRHICMVCIDFDPVTFTGMPAKGPAPACGHWVWFRGYWVSRGRYEQLMKEKEEREKKNDEKANQEQVEEVACNTTTRQEPKHRGSVITFSQFKEAYNNCA